MAVPLTFQQLPNLSNQKLPQGIEIARLREQIRRDGQIKEKWMTLAQEKQARLLAELHLTLK